MNSLYCTIGAIFISVPIAAGLKITSIQTGMLAVGINILFLLISKE